MKMETGKILRRTGILLAIVYLLLMLTYVALVTHVNAQLKIRKDTVSYDNCFKVWATRGLVTKGNIKAVSSGNSVETISAAFDAGAKGSEIDIYYDVESKDFVISHDRPYNLKNGALLSLKELLKHIGKDHYLWLDWKKLGELSSEQVTHAAEMLDKLTFDSYLKNKLFIEGTDPINLSILKSKGFNTIFDTGPLPENDFLAPLVADFYKTIYYYGGFSVIAMNYGSIDNPIYGEKTQLQLENIPVFIYHVPDNEDLIQNLANIKQVKVILNNNHSVNSYHIKTMTNAACVN